MSKVEKVHSAGIGLGLILLGGLGLILLNVNEHSFLGLGTLIGFVFTRLWPLLILAIGSMFCAAPILFRKRSLGGLFIPGMPILALGSILLIASLSQWWSIWAFAWPWLILALGFGFFLAAATFRNVWLMIPALILWFNGLAFQFCAVTGLWESWAWLWTIEPFSLGIALLIANFKARSKGLLIAGIILCGFAGVAFLLMTLIMANWWVINFIGPAILAGAGLVLLLWTLIQQRSSTSLAD